MSKKNFQGASVALIKELDDFRTGYFDHSHFVAAENKSFVKGFEPLTSDSALKPLKEAHKHSVEMAEAMDTVLGHANALTQTSTICKQMAEAAKSALEKEEEHISKRLVVREDREPVQDKDMTAFLVMQQDERAAIDADFEKRVADLKAQYTV